MPEDSLKKRYFYKLGTNLIGLPISIIIQSIIPRGLGPENYGNFSFLSNFFAQIVTFLDSGTSMAFYTKLSQRQNDQGLVKFYWQLVVIIIILLALFVMSIFILNKQEFLWPDQHIKFVWMGMFWGTMSWVSNILYKIIDAYGVTRQGEIVKILQKAFSLILISCLFLLNIFTLSIFFLYHYLLFIFLIIGFRIVLKKNGFKVFPSIKLNRQVIKGYSIEFYKYSAPLIFLAFFNLIAGIFGRWFLQKISGSTEQAYFGLSYQIGIICFVFTSAMTPLIIREFSIAFHKKEFVRMKELFLKYIPLLYSFAAFISVFLSINAEKVVFIMGGDKFENAMMPITIMVLYPIHQTYGQLSGSVFLATGKTKLFRNIGIFASLIGITFTYYLLAPAHMFGLNLGATGLAIKMVIIQFIAVNIQLWYNCRFLKMSFMKLLGNQILIIIVFSIVGFISKYLVYQIFGGILISFIMTGVIYCSISALIVYAFPKLFSLSRKEIRYYYNISINNIRRKKG